MTTLFSDTIFTNEPFLNFADPATRAQMEAALNSLNQRIIKKEVTATPVINGARDALGMRYERIDPADKNVVIGATSFANVAQAEHALRVASEHASYWAHTPVTERIALLKRIAQKMRDRRFEVQALIIREIQKSWLEADVEFGEAVDFVEYYALRMEQLSVGAKTFSSPLERSIYKYKSRGVSVAISPWNFPFAIAAGMCVAALVCGCPVIFKPSEQSSLVGALLADIIYSAGTPKEIFHFVPGIGEEVGATLSESPLTHIINFTGSAAVGLHLVKVAADRKPGQHFVKRVVAEMGGKNSLIIDEDADLEKAVQGTLAAAFGYAGQKCSALSRLIILKPVYEQFLERLASALPGLTIGNSIKSESNLPAVIDQESHARLLKAIQFGKDSLKVAAQLPVPENLRGNFVPPTIFRDVPTSHKLWNEEQFGPVLCALPANSFEEAVAIANNNEYALTGGAFTRNPAHLKYAEEYLEAGNLYFNRKITGAYVWRQPFGGYKLSGLGSKAGGPDYLLQFLEPQTVTYC